ncbi:MAG TPA: tripartite tricarboxylate transporter substrate-binding protein, partial [Burkholderiales bacterium]|nr:tripartite tricarboxylate transporter substrate-binding protein [Burkholderiales bacterium]
MRTPLLAGLGLVLVAGSALAQSWPSRPVRIVVPTAPGGGVDFTARLVGQRLSERLGQQIIVDNRAGAGGVIAMDHVAKAVPDGYTLLLGFSGPLVMTPHAEKVAYDPQRDFAGVSQLTSFHLMLATHPSLPVRSVKQLIAFARARPGELNYASGNIWTLTHLGPELLKIVTGINVVPIHYKGTGPAAVAVLAGEAHMLYASPAALLPHVRANRLVGLAVAGPERMRLAPEVPTLAEAGVRGADTPSWQALLAPARTPGEAIGRLNGELARIAAAPDYREQLERQG